MKTKPETELFRVLTGSRLYGTDTPTSDYDWKHVCLPALDDVLLNVRLTNRKVKPEGSSASDKMLPGQEESEYIPLQVFLSDAFNGQTYALELVFAVAQGLFEVPGESETSQVLKIVRAPDVAVRRAKLQELCQTIIDRFLTSNVKAMVGYAYSQALLYSGKTERYDAVKVAIEAIDSYVGPDLDLLDDRLASCPKLYRTLLTLHSAKEVMIPNAKGGSDLAPAYELVGKQFPLTNTVFTIKRCLHGTLKSYGERVKSFSGAKADWKAMSHALRITEQVLELCGTGKLVFPRPNATFLRDMKEGKVPLYQATSALNEAFSKVDGAVQASILKERTPELEAAFREWTLKVLKDFYELS